MTAKHNPNCEACTGTGWYGDNGPGKKGNAECQPCDQCGTVKDAAPEVCECGHAEDRHCPIHVSADATSPCWEEGCSCRKYRPAAPQAAETCQCGHPKDTHNMGGQCMVFIPQNDSQANLCGCTKYSPAAAPRCPTCGGVGEQTTEQHARHPRRWYCLGCLEWWDESRRKPCQECAELRQELTKKAVAERCLQDEIDRQVAEVAARTAEAEQYRDERDFAERRVLESRTQCANWKRSYQALRQAMADAEARCKELEKAHECSQRLVLDAERRAGAAELVAAGEKQRADELAKRIERASEILAKYPQYTDECHRAAAILRGEGEKA